MPVQITPGLTADWLNAWLAAIGVTVLVPETRLSWTDDPIPKARFTHHGHKDLAELVAEALPTVDELHQLVIAGLPQNVPKAQYTRAAEAARRRGDLSLGVLTTDIAGEGKGGALPNGPFNVGAPRGETLFTRLRACRHALDATGKPLDDLVQATFDGRGERHDVNGLGFDYRRLAGSVPGEATKMADPVVECLCFYGLLLHPVGGNGARAPRQRGWTTRPAQRHAFRWPAWRPPLDRWAIDALLDTVYATLRPGPAASLAPWRLLGVTALYGSVAFKPTGSSDPTRGYASERLA